MTDIPDPEFLVVGGGLSGLALADRLTREGRDWRLIEGRTRFGGRIAGLAHGGTTFDLGPSWIWPGQSRVAATTARFGIPLFEQYSDGATCHEGPDGTVRRVEAFSPMAGSLRMTGGMTALVAALVRALEPERLHLDAPIVALSRHDDRIEATLRSGETLRARQVVLAIPPRIASALTFDPPLPEAATRAMGAIPTWMSGMAKFVAVYDRPFWRAAGLSGDATSRRGPMVEIHDASAAGGNPGALFGFLGVPASAREAVAAELAPAGIDQLAHLFGEESRAPVATRLVDWAREPFTATTADHAPLGDHPAYGPHPALTDLWDGHLHIAVTETAPDAGGLIEGALAAAEAVILR